ncbi:MAG: type I methionyl aminopeptidase [Microscillaceae bacterium]|nr:type I methionyl aminopeptidase [Microscillaceae bacterium]MDW8461818.1 type I methionyl aminopeptidase [Cytophagales bacterium]
MKKSVTANNIIYKTREEIELIRKSADILGRVHGEIAKMIKPGVKTLDLDKRAEEFIRDNGAIPSFKNFPNPDSRGIPFPGSLCISVNDEVVHGMPNHYELKEGDIVSIDCGVFYEGFHSDSAYTYAIGEISPKAKKLLQVTKQALFEAIAQMKENAKIADLSRAIQQYVEKNGFSVVRELVGHGIGRELHESPEVPNFVQKPIRPIFIKEGMVLAIEPMINMGGKSVYTSKDRWTIKTSDRKPSAHFEHTVAFLDGKPEVLTTFKYIEETYQLA